MSSFRDYLYRELGNNNHLKLNISKTIELLVDNCFVY